MPFKKLDESALYKMWFDANNSNSFSINNCTATSTANVTRDKPKPPNSEFDLKPIDIIFSNPATIVYWNDGTKTVVKIMDGDIYDETYGVAMCYTKKIFGSNSKFKKMIDGFLKKHNEIKLNKFKKVEEKFKNENKINSSKSNDDSLCNQNKNKPIFKVGDRVICKGYVDVAYNTYNKTGTIMYINTNKAIVNFDDYVGGWKDGRFSIKDGHGLYVNLEGLKLLNEFN